MIDQAPATRIPLFAFTLAAALAATGCSKPGDPAQARGSEPASSAVATGRIVAINANDSGFSPSEIEAKPGEALTLRFTRTTQSECVNAVVFPDLKIKKDLPLNVAVDIPVRADKDTIKFMCWMGMVHGKVVIKGG
jgi:plastocyanin domain-containing protein